MPYDGNAECRLTGPLWLLRKSEERGERKKRGLGKCLSKETVSLVMRNICFPSQTRVFVFYPDRFYDTWVFLNNENAWLTASVREIERN